MRTLAKNDLAWWIGDDRHPIPCRIELVTPYRVYLQATGNQPHPTGRRVWYEPLTIAAQRIAPRDRTYHHGRRAWHNPHDTRFKVSDDE